MDAGRVKVPAHLPDKPAVRDDILNYYCEVQQFDKECGAILRTLAARGELENTVVVVTSDNGWQMPRGLANCYDLGVRIPMAMRYPARVKAGERREDFVSIGDLAATFLEAAGVALPAGLTASSLFSGKRRDAMFLERERHANVRAGNLSYPVRGVRTREFLYLRNFEPKRWPAGDPVLVWAVGPYGDVDDSPSKRLIMAEKAQPYFDLCFGKRPEEELYDLRKDPGQVRNVAGEAGYAKVQAELAAKVAGWMKETGDPRADAPRTDYWDRAAYSGPRFRGTPPKE